MLKFNDKEVAVLERVIDMNPKHCRYTVSDIEELAHFYVEQLILYVKVSRNFKHMKDSVEIENDIITKLEEFAIEIKPFDFVEASKDYTADSFVEIENFEE